MARTVGFSLTKEDEARLDRLLERRRTNNRSKFLREAIAVMERYDLVGTLEELQAYGELRAAAAGRTQDDIPDLVADVAAVDDSELRAHADRLLDGFRHTRIEDIQRLTPLPAARAFLEQLSAEGPKSPGGGSS